MTLRGQSTKKLPTTEDIHDLMQNEREKSVKEYIEYGINPSYYITDG